MGKNARFIASIPAIVVLMLCNLASYAVLLVALIPVAIFNHLIEYLKSWVKAGRLDPGEMDAMKEVERIIFRNEER